MPDSLHGLRVLDFGQGAAGPYCGQLLADHGADVIKVEPPRGDWSRDLGRHGSNGQSAPFISLNRNKRGICLDLKRERSANAARQLALRADVIVENFRSGVMERFGLGYEQLRPSNRRLIYCSITGFGDSGPNRDMPAGDSTMQGYSGLMSIIGEEDGPPTRVGNVVGDMIAGTNAFSGVLLALYSRLSDDRGRRVRTSLLDSMIAFQAPPLTEYLLTGEAPQRTGNQHPFIAPSGEFRTADGYVVLTVLSHQWPKFCERMGHAELADDPRFATHDARQANRKLLNADLAPLFKSITTQETLVRLGAADVVCAPINTYADLVVDPQVVHNRLVGHMQFGESTYPMIRNPVRIGDLEESNMAPPTIGQHTREVLAGDLGWDEEEISELINQEVVLTGT